MSRVGPVSEFADLASINHSINVKSSRGSFPWSGRKGENTPFTNNVDKKSVNNSGPTVVSQH